jgi:hypothetical protein
MADPNVAHKLAAILVAGGRGFASWNGGPAAV